MKNSTAHAKGQSTRQVLLVASVMALALLVGGVTGALSAAWGYALLVIAGLAFAAGAAHFSVLVLSRLCATQLLVSRTRLLLLLGAVTYVLAVAALAGHYTHESLQGRMELYWIIFGPVVLWALVAFDHGIYRKLVKTNLGTWNRFRQFIRRQDADPAAMRATFVDEVIVHRSLWRTSKLRWVRHALIFWGFVIMFLVELLAVFVREAMPAFGWQDVWRIPGHPVRLTFDLAYDVTGLMILVGCVLALCWRLSVQGKPERKFADTPMVLFLLFVVVTGFLLEGWRMAQVPSDPAHAMSFVGAVFGQAMIASGMSGSAVFQPLWLVHVIASCALIGYLPATRLVHTCATPLGRLMNSQKGLLAAKKFGVLSGLVRGSAPTGISAGVTRAPSTVE